MCKLNKLRLFDQLCPLAELTQSHRHRQRATRRARSRSGAGKTSSGRSNLGWPGAAKPGPGSFSHFFPRGGGPHWPAAVARAAQASQGAGSALLPPHKVPWRLSAVSPFVDPAQLLVLHQPVHALHKRFTCVRWLTPLLDGMLTLYTPHFRSLVRAPHVHLMTKKMTPQPKVVGGPPSGHFARLPAHRASSS